MEPKISVIIPAYNAEKYIIETLTSVLDQTYTNYDVFVVDDGSKDNTLNVLKELGNRINIISKSNNGPASARNLAIKNSDGDLIAFLDSDDLWVKNKLNVEAEFLDDKPSVGLIYSEALMFSQSGIERDIRRKIGYTESPTFCKLLFGDFIPNSTVVIRRSCINTVGLLDEDRKLIAVEDYEYWMRIAREYHLAGIPRPLAYYRISEDNLIGDGEDINKGLNLAIAAINRIESRYPDLWKTCGIERNLLLARLHIRSGFGWKKQRKWRNCLHKFAEALNYSFTPRTFRWLAAAMILKRWS